MAISSQFLIGVLSKKKRKLVKKKTPKIKTSSTEKGVRHLKTVAKYLSHSERTGLYGHTVPAKLPKLVSNILKVAA